MRNPQKTLSNLAITGLCTLLISGPAAAGNATFTDVCQSCHNGGFKGWISGAPNINDKEQWQKYIERDSIEMMRTTLINGSDNHKVKGGCSECSDQQIIDAIDYIMSRVR
ncbi:c-type cytochrome [Aestuariirhabdus sp. Z084]|uniref:c-type cytochrome n=1 Tax=Aestuariirhabdus haliotis TaxID=2918751 RepID=UPI00201B3E2C|nr:c-type cytochrome [Aestuariirhabdus haliotis]MCL6417701.1 c-type cytochrome [Aestuariirhabdus haliotis]MCL6421642.1 c-type cytochrome [Aestuariirhabdus haliotis]